MFKNCTQLTNADFFSGVTAAYASAFNSTFYNCSSLTEINLSSLTNLEGYYCADYICVGCSSLKRVYLSKLNNTGLGGRLSFAFDGCTALELVDFHLATAVPAISTNTFQNTNSTFQIVVPDALYTQWISATNWSALASQIVKWSEYTPAS